MSIALMLVLPLTIVSAQEPCADPYPLCVGTNDVYQATVPAEITNIQWTFDDGSGAVDIAAADGGNSSVLQITEPGVYVYTGLDAGGCPVELCCPLEFYPACFDLALMKVLSSAGPFIPGDDVTFTITLYNQGNIDATSVSVIDYIPAGMSLNDGMWTDNMDGTASYTGGLSNLLAGTSASVDITLSIDSNFQGTSLVNYAEISGATNALGLSDVDSTPDIDATNDAGGQADSPSDDALNGDGSGVPGDNVAVTDEDDQDPASVVVGQVFDLALMKVLSSAGPFSPGDDVTFTITLYNQGNIDATSVSVIDYIPAGMSLNDGMWTDNMDGTASYTGGLSNLLAGTSASVDITLSIDSNFQGTSLVNYAEISGATNALGLSDVDSTPDSDATNDAGGQPNSPADNAVNGNGTGMVGGGVASTDEDDQDPALIPVTIQASFVDIELDKSVSTAFVSVNDIITYTITVVNKGPDVATGVTVYDMLPAGLQYVGDNGSYNPTTGIWTIGILPVNSPISLDIYAKVVSINDPIVNVAEVETTNETDIDSEPGNNNGSEDVNDEDDEDSVPIFPVDMPQIDLELSKTVNYQVVENGDIITYTISIVNKGPDAATGVSVYDQLPYGIQFVGASGNYNPATGIWYVGNLGVNQTATLYVYAFVTNITGPITNIAEVETANETDIDSTPGDNNNNPNVDDYDDEDSATIIPTQQYIDLELTKVVNQTQVQVGDEITYTLSIINKGPDAATGVSVYDMLPVGLEYIDSDGNYNPTTGIWYIGNLAVGEELNLDIVATVLSINGNTVNIAEVETANEQDIDSTPGDNNGSPNVDDFDDEDSAIITPMIPIVDVELSKEVNQQVVSVGDMITYTITVWNNGPSTATGVSVYDMLPAGLNYISSDGNYDPSTGIWYVGTIEKDASFSLDIEAEVVAINGPITNIAEVETTNEQDIDSFPGDNNGSPNVNDYDDEDSAIIVPSENPTIDLELVKSVNTYNVSVGDMITYTITVVNKGPDNATGVSVYDMLPAGLNYVISDGNYDPITGIWYIGDLAVNQTMSLDIYAEVVSISGPIVNIAEIETANETDIDSYPGDNNGNPNVNDYDDEDDAVIVPNEPLVIDLELSKEVNTYNVSAGDVITYTITVWNEGPDNATGVSVYDMLPAGLNFVNSNGDYDPSTGIWYIGDLAVNGSTSLSIEAEVVSISDQL
ncbi:MAG: DUF11 domain-containing protein [Chitinophagales bacterium]